MTQSETLHPNGATAKELPKQQPSESAKQAFSKFSASYWESRVYRPTYTRDGARSQVSQFFVQIAHGGRRHAIALATNNADEAGRRAARLFKCLKQSGWDAALKMFRPDAQPRGAKALTIGRFIDLAEKLVPMPKRTSGNYRYALRRIAADIAGAKVNSGSRFDPGGAWREAVDDLPLTTITPVAVEDWRVRFVRAHTGDPAAEQRAVRSVNSYLGNAKSFFSRRVLEAFRLRGIELPSPLPFDGVRKQDKAGHSRYRSEINAAGLLSAARTELGEKDPDAYAVVLLALGAGLRRAEIDGLQWQHVMSDRGIIRVMTTAQRRLKSEESEGDVHVDAGLFSELEKTKREGKTLFVVEPEVEFRITAAAQFYRCEETFRRVTAWLRAQGVTSNKPLHTLRKEFGALITSAGDIYQAQRQLRHSEISTTEQYYADTQKRTAVPITALLSPPNQTRKEKGSK